MSESAEGLPLGPRGDWPEEVQRRWADAERAIVANPHMRDVYEDVHEPGEPFPASHVTGRGEATTPHRYDHIFASRDLETRRCEYLAGWLVRDDHGRRLSDHSPVVTELAVQC